MTIWEIIWFVLRLIIEGWSRKTAVYEASRRYGVEPAKIERYLP